jgi:hypothetical protein
MIRSKVQREAIQHNPRAFHAQNPRMEKLRGGTVWVLACVASALALMGLLACRRMPSPSSTVIIDAGVTSHDAGGEAASASAAPNRLDPRVLLDPFDKIEEEGEPGPWVNGRFSRLRLRPLRHPRHDTDFGSTSIEIESTTPGGPPSQTTSKEGQWRILVYAEGIGVYVLGGIFERGACLPLDVLVYVDEHTGKWRDSYVSDTRWMAMAAVPSPGGRFIALIADAEDSDKGFELEVLDTTTDTLIRVGKAPLPPPMQGDYADFCPRSGRAGWIDPTDSFVDMDPGIIKFIDEQTIAVSYGHDSCRRRARQRHLEKWNLAAAFATHKKIEPKKFD